MYTAAELLAAVDTRYRRRFPLHAERAFGEFPPTWRLWFLAIEQRPDAVTGAPAADWIGVFAGRPLRAPPTASPPLGRVRALRALLRARWEPAPREERGLRALSATLSALLHVVLVFVFFWVAMVRIAPPTPSSQEAGEVTQVEFIGDGTPETPGDAAPQSAVEEAQRGQPAAGSAEAADDPQAEASAAASPADADAPAQSDAAPAADAAETADASSPPVSSPPVSSPVAAAEPSESQVATQAPTETPPVETPPLPAQPLVVVETAVPDSSFTLPPTTLRLPERPRAALPPAAAAPPPAREIPLVERNPAAASLPLPQRRPTRALTTPDVAPSREIPLVRRSADVAALPLPQAPAVRLPEAAAGTRGREPVLAPRTASESIALPLPGGTAQRRLPAAGSAASAREIPLRAPPAATAGDAGGAQGRPSSAPAGRPDTGGAAARGAATASAPTPAGRPGGEARAGAGPRPANPPGGVPTPVRGDDWGVSDRNRPGSGAGQPGASGLFNRDGSVRLPGDGGGAGGGLPPGTITEDFAKIDRMGTWLKRPPVDYTPSRFDKFFVPNESLLEEWVRRNVREVFVPIPGTGKRLRCVVSILQAAGGCTIDDPNLRDQEAEARPPPAVPYKPELQDRE